VTVRGGGGWCAQLGVRNFLRDGFALLVRDPVAYIATCDIVVVYRYLGVRGSSPGGAICLTVQDQRLIAVVESF
jgi:hypothetical protein